MQAKWEYKIVLRSRGWDDDKRTKNAPWMVATNWNVDMEKTLSTLGDEGWELVTVTPRSGYLGAHGGEYTRDFAGYTSEELWVFKRLKN